MAKKLNKARLAEKYAAALFDGARDQNAVDIVAGEMRELERLIAQSAELNALVVSAAVSAKTRALAFELIAGKMELSVTTRGFLGVLIENGRTFLLPLIFFAFTRIYEKYKGILSVHVVSARKLSEPTIERLTGVLRGVFDREIRLDLNVDPDLIGGMTVRVGSFMADASVKTKLQKLNLVMKGVGV